MTMEVHSDKFLLPTVKTSWTPFLFLAENPTFGALPSQAEKVERKGYVLWSYTHGWVQRTILSHAA